MQRVVVRQRVGQPDRVGRQAQGGQRPARHERVRQHLDVPLLGQRPPDRAAAALARGEPAAGRGDRQRAGHLVEAVEPDDLLGQVGRAEQVGPPARRGDVQDGVEDDRDRAADLLQQLRHPLGGYGTPISRDGRAGSSAMVGRGVG